MKGAGSPALLCLKIACLDNEVVRMLILVFITLLDLSYRREWNPAGAIVQMGGMDTDVLTSV